MRVEQPIGRIDRLGQQNQTIQIVNLHYKDTVETDVYRALRNRIGLFESVVGRVQLILAHVPRTISQTVLSGKHRDARERATVVDAIEQETREREGCGFDIDTVTERDLAMPERAPSSVTMEDLDRMIGRPDVMPPGTDVQPMGRREYGLLAPGMTERLRVTTDPEYFEEHAESMPPEPRRRPTMPSLAPLSRAHTGLGLERPTSVEITILAHQSGLPATFPWLSDWLLAAGCPRNRWNRCAYFVKENWSRRADSNRGPADYESAALPTELRRQYSGGAPPVDRCKRKS